MPIEYKRGPQGGREPKERGEYDIGNGVIYTLRGYG